MLCGDFNARTGATQVAGLSAPTWERSSSDHMICPRGRWLLDQLSLLGMGIANGCTPNTGVATCIRHNGSSVVDYLCVKNPPTNFTVCTEVLSRVSDHAALIFSIPGYIPIQTDPPASGGDVVYRWVEGSHLRDYAKMWQTWRAYTSSKEFCTGMKELQN